MIGYETTANAIVYGLITLALRPDIQKKVIEEIDQQYITAAAEGRGELTYDDDFGKLEYTYGFMVRLKFYSLVCTYLEASTKHFACSPAWS
jgi:neutral trehalase